MLDAFGIGAVNDSVANIMTGGFTDPLDEFAPTLLPPWGGDGLPMPKYKTLIRSGFVLGDEIADRNARQTGVEPQGMDWLTVAKSQLGSPYVWAEANPIGPEGGAGDGFDCSGFTQWVYKRALGVNLAHQSTQQSKQTQKVSRDDLTPGDLVFFSYGRLGKGVVDHVGIYVGNGQMIAASSSRGKIVTQSVDWSHFVQGGRAQGAGAAPAEKPKKPKKKTPAPMGPVDVLKQYGNLIPVGAGALKAAMSSIDSVVPIHTRAGATPEPGRSFAGPNADVKAELYQGFLDAGRPDLANMVPTKAFDIWMNAENGWTTKPFPYNGQTMYGLFQFNDVHPWVNDYVRNGVWTATPYEEAQLVAKYFRHLKPGDIRQYADQILGGEYGGWG